MRRRRMRIHSLQDKEGSKRGERVGVEGKSVRRKEICGPVVPDRVFDERLETGLREIRSGALDLLAGLR